jgi:hypothetical protein
VPDIRQQMIASNAQGMAQQNQQQISQKRAAASSIAGQRGGGAGVTNSMEDMSIRQMLEAQLSGGNRL